MQVAHCSDDKEYTTTIDRSYGKLVEKTGYNLQDKFIRSNKIKYGAIVRIIITTVNRNWVFFSSY